MRTELKEEELTIKDVSVVAMRSCIGVDYVCDIRVVSNNRINAETLKLTHKKEVSIPEKLGECADLMGVDKETALDLMWKNYINK